MTTPNPERSVDRLLRQTLPARPGSGVVGGCLDAETLAAWVDGGLQESERAAVEAHTADCARCLAMAAALAKDSGVPAAAPQPWWRGNLGWLVPATACAAALALWVAVPDRTAPVSVPPASPRAAVEPDVSQSQSVSRPVAPAARPDGFVGAPPPPPASDTGRRREPVALGRVEETRSAPVQEAKQEAANAVPAEALDARQKEAPARQRLATADELASSAPESAVLPAAPAAATRSAEFRAAAPSRAPGVAAENLAQAPAVIVSSEASARWRVGRAGLVQRSSDGGATWEVLTSGVTTDLLAGSSPSSSVFWVVGRAGTVLLAADGRRFVRVPFPEAVDLTGVAAASARIASVTTADGRTFRTDDGGARWTENR